MNAWVVQTYNQPLELTDLPEPSPSDHDVFVEIHVTAVNVLDVKVQAGEFKAILSYKPPFVLGHDLAGMVTAIGPEVTRFAVGDEVYGRPRDGRVDTFAQRLAVHEDDLARRPTTISIAEAASVPLVARGAAANPQGGPAFDVARASAKLGPKTRNARIPQPPRGQPLARSGSGQFGRACRANQGAQRCSLVCRRREADA